MCDTLQLNWKLPTTPVAAISSSLSSIKDNNTHIKHNNNVTSLSSNINKIKSIKNQVTNKKENLNHNTLVISTRERSAARTNMKATMSKKSNRKTSNRKTDGKYVLRDCSIKKRNEVEVKKAQPKKRGPKPRPKPQPMSKYRRKTANLRERERMGEINNAFDHLKEKIPTPLVVSENSKSCNGNEKRNRCEKMTKINVLHIAINYIRALESILDTGDAGTQVYGTSIVQSPRLSVPNTLVENLEMLKENRNMANEARSQKPGMKNKRIENKTRELLKSINNTTKHKKKARKMVSSTKSGQLKGKEKNYNGNIITTPVKEESNFKKELLFHANISEKLNQLKPVMPSNFLGTSLIQKNASEKSVSTQERHDDVKSVEYNDVSNSNKYCPDWTELTPTLEFPDVATNYGQESSIVTTTDSCKTVNRFSHTPDTEINNESKGQNENDIAKKVKSSNDSSSCVNIINGPNGTSKISNRTFLSQSSGDATYFSKPVHTISNSNFESLQNVPQSRGNLDTLLSSVATNAQPQSEKENCTIKMNQHPNLNSYAQRKLKTKPKLGVNFLNCDLVFKTNVPWLTNSPSPPIFGRQPSFPDVFGAADDPDFLFEELTKASFPGEGNMLSDEDLENSYSAPFLGSYPKSFSMSSGNGSILSSDGSASSPEESDTTMMDYIDDTFQISI